MDKSQFVLRCLTWLGANAGMLVELVKACVPLAAVLVAGYALYVVKEKSNGR